MRLIDADALHYWNPGHLTTGLWLSIADIQNAPTVPSITLKDHIEYMGRATIKCINAEKRLEQFVKENTVIKCKDCRYRRKYPKGWYCGYEYDSSDPYEMTRRADDENYYCADAERKEEE